MTGFRITFLSITILLVAGIWSLPLVFCQTDSIQIDLHVSKDSVSVSDTLTISDMDTSFSVVADSSDSIMPQFRKIENNAFALGEHLVFDVVFGLVTIGTATMSIPDTQLVNGRSCYHVVTTAQSNKTISKIFKVRDRVETFIDVEGIFPWRFEKHIREGKYRSDRYVTYDQINHRVFYKKDTLEVEPFVQGILSSFYYVRTLPLKVGEHFNINNFGDGKIYPLRILVHKKDRISVSAGTFDCIVVEPVLRQEGIFNQKGRMAIWLTDDERRIPVLMKSKILIGSIDARLRSIEIMP